MAYDARRELPELIESMKRAAAALRDADVPYMLGGGLAAWARGGPPTEHDVDFFVRPPTPSARSTALVEAGMKAGAPARGLAAEGVGRRRARRPDLQPGRRHRRRRLLRARRGDGGGGAAAPGRLPRRRADDEAAGAERAGARPLLGARARPLAAGADRLGVRAGADGGLAVRAARSSRSSRSSGSSTPAGGPSVSKKKSFQASHHVSRLDADRAAVEPLDARVEAEPVGAACA